MKCRRKVDCFPSKKNKLHHKAPKGPMAKRGVAKGKKWCKSRKRLCHGPLMGHFYLLILSFFFLFFLSAGIDAPPPRGGTKEYINIRRKRRCENDCNLKLLRDGGFSSIDAFYDFPSSIPQKLDEWTSHFINLCALPERGESEWIVEILPIYERKSLHLSLSRSLWMWTCLVNLLYITRHQVSCL